MQSGDLLRGEDVFQGRAAEECGQPAEVRGALLGGAVSSHQQYRPGDELHEPLHLRPRHRLRVEQARAALYYIVKYLSKEIVSLNLILPIYQVRYQMPLLLKIHHLQASKK